MGPTVILRHELPDGSWHYDWLIARREAPGGADERVLIAFRAGWRADEVPAGADGLEATRMADHRVAYLTFEGAVSGGRGSVRRVAEGRARIIRDEAEALVVEVDFGRGAATLRGRPIAGGDADRWVFASEG